MLNQTDAHRFGDCPADINQAPGSPEYARTTHDLDDYYSRDVYNHSGFTSFPISTPIQQYGPPIFPTSVSFSASTLCNAPVAPPEDLSNAANITSLPSFGIGLTGESTQLFNSLHLTTYDPEHYYHAPEQSPSVPHYDNSTSAQPFLGSPARNPPWGQAPFLENKILYPVRADNAESGILPTLYPDITLPHSTLEPARTSSSAQIPKVSAAKSTSSTTARLRRANYTRARKQSKKSFEKYKPCPLCGNLFNPKKSNWRRHMDAHNGEKRFQCTFQGCGERKTTKDQVVVHIVTHHMKKKLGKGVDKSENTKRRITANQYVAVLD